MKKLILTGATLLAFAATSLAQNNQATLNQAGNQQTGTATQSGSSLQSNIQQTTASGITNVGNYANTSQVPIIVGSSGNQANVNQLGTKSGFANIGQEGSGNLSTINQQNNNGGSGTPITSASAPGPVANANNVPNAAGISAVTTAGGNYANTYQRGNNETVLINQNNASTSNYADSRQDNYSAGQSVIINQNNTSTGNKATANQFGDSNTQTISQSNNSSGNTANVRQGFSTAQPGYNGTTISNTVGAVATVQQNGIVGGSPSTGNQSTINQIGTGAGASATTQQNAGLLGPSQNNTAEINQFGGVQTALIQQNNFSILNQAKVDQTSPDNGNVATIRQNDASVFNQATILQTAGAGRTATIDQINSSSNNKAAIKQQGGSVAGSGASSAYITQTQGSNNQGYIDQNSYAGSSAVINQHSTSGSTAKITQNTTYFDYGNTNIADIEQTGGVGNTATIDQDYSANTAKLKQDGSGNTATFKQLIGDGNVIKGLNSSPVALQQGTGNSLTVTQTSTNTLGPPFGPYVPNTASVQQIGTGNMGNITQAGF